MSREETFSKNKRDHVREGDSVSRKIKPGVSIKLKPSQKEAVDDIIEQNRASLVMVRTLAREIKAQEESLWGRIENWYPELEQYHTSYNWRNGVVEVLEKIGEDESDLRQHSGHAPPPFGDPSQAMEAPFNEISGDAPKHEEAEREDRLAKARFAGKLKGLLKSLRDSLNEEGDDE